MTQKERINLMEQHLDRVKEAVAALAEALDKCEAEQEAVDALSKYYGSRQWRKDLADDEAGRLPPDLKRGVLAEDGIWNVLEEWRELKERMAVVCNK